MLIHRTTYTGIFKGNRFFRSPVVIAMTSAEASFTRLGACGSPWRARAWKVCFVASLALWTLGAVGFGGVSWSHATSIARVNQELQDMRTLLQHVSSMQLSRTPQNHGMSTNSVSGPSRHDFIAQTAESPVDESCCDRVSTLQIRVDSLQQEVNDISLQLDQKASLMHVMALQDALDQKANVQNVSRLQQDLFELSRDLDQKANTVDVTALRNDLAQKANADSMTQLQAQVGIVQDAVRQKASLQNFSRLEVVVRGKASVGDLARKANETAVDTVRAQLTAAEALLRQKADAASTPKYADLPVTPNMLQDTKHFQGMCHGRVGVVTSWADAWGSPWRWYDSSGTAVDAAASTVEVVDMTSQASAERAGLWPLGALSASNGGLLGDDFYGADLRALLLTVQTLPAAGQGAVGVIM